MDDTFERLIRSKFDDYTVSVDPDDWSKIAARLTKKRSRRLIRWAGAAATAAAILLLTPVLTNEPPSRQDNRGKDVAEQRTTKPHDPAGRRTPDDTVESDEIAARLQSPNNPTGTVEQSETKTSEENESTSGTDKPTGSTRESDMTTAGNKENGEIEVAESNKALYEPLPKQDKPSDSKKNKNDVGWMLAGNFGTSSSASKSTNNRIIPLKSGGTNGLLKNYNNAKYTSPLSFGLTVRKNFGKRVGMETGLTYSYLQATYENVSASDEKWISHYLGIPVNAVLYIWNTNPRWDVYLSVGGMVEKGLAEKCTETSLTNGSTSTYKYSINGLQWSLNGAAGVTYKFTKEFGLYFEPKASYCFNARSQHSIRNDWPLAFGINAGLRYSF
jgi:hypothetical protein